MWATPFFSCESPLWGLTLASLLLSYCYMSYCQVEAQVALAREVVSHTVDVLRQRGLVHRGRSRHPVSILRGTDTERAGTDDRCGARAPGHGWVTRRAG